VALVVIAWMGCWLAGCTISRNIVPLEPPADVPPLEELGGDLDFMVRQSLRDNAAGAAQRDGGRPSAGHAGYERLAS